ncbi:NAD-dependent epimerase/dehydratase family protein [Microlunatus sp. Gsoil 973]|uniref:NAD-dependent epimerase/dehydratase family protein n=1 Tax=Microlunatus sp. Gsoil 973 TaxID=2672569 RepID=UPI001E4BB355|nr:NAD-dependent epimerase/dehydratase family protein [Microlunatus sp. Gsoil 973]
MKIVVIGGTGHIGGYLVPMLVEDGHRVTVVSRDGSPKYRDDPAWQQVDKVALDRTAEDAAGTFAGKIADLGPDVVVDMICFTEDSARALVAGLTGRVRRLVHIGTIWVHGRLTEVPVTEDAVRHPWGEYGTQKNAIEQYLLSQSRTGVPTAIVHPGHISGPGWPVINPQGDGEHRRLADAGPRRGVAAAGARTGHPASRPRRGRRADRTAVHRPPRTG